MTSIRIRLTSRRRPLATAAAFVAVCAAGQAVGDGRLRRLGVETCPGTSKSLFWAVIFPAWLLLRTHGTARIMAGSYAHTFAERVALCRFLADQAETVLVPSAG